MYKKADQTRDARMGIQFIIKDNFLSNLGLHLARRYMELALLLMSNTDFILQRKAWHP